MAVARSMPTGLAMPRPTMSGAEPCTGSNSPGPSSLRLAEPAVPSPPVSAAAWSDRMSPKVFSVTSTSNRCGRCTSCMATLSTSRCSTVTSGNSSATRWATDRHIFDVAITLDLSTDTSWRRRPWAMRAAARTMRSTSDGWYSQVSNTVPSGRVPRWP